VAVSSPPSPAASLVVPEQAAAAGEERIGGKAAGLGRLLDAGARVPQWFALPAELFSAHLLRSAAALVARELEALRGLSLAHPDTRIRIEAASTRLRAAVESTPLDETSMRVVQAALARLGVGPYAVRSSMVGEDSATHSFAGQLDSFLFQRSAGDVARSIVRCWSSAFSARALAYQLRSGQALATPRMGVIVQQMIAGRVSGVLFTAHPITGRRDHALLSACWGAGEGIVGGTCNTDEFVWGAGRELSAKLAQKDVQLIAAAGAAGLRQVPVEAEKQAIRCLTPDEVSRICAEGLRIAERLGAPQDIEWTLDGDAIYILQSRPITTLQAQDGPRVLWDNSNIQESFCGVTLPLTFSYARAAYASAYEQAERALGIPKAIIEADRPRLRALLGHVSGRVYYNINNWYRGLLLLPSFGRNKADMEKMMGLEEPVDFIEDQVLSAGEKLRRLPRLLLTLLRLLRRFATIERDVAHFLARTDAIFRSVDRAGLETAPLSRLLAIGERIRSEVFEHWHTPIVGDFYVMMSVGRLRRLVERTAGAEAPALLASLLGGEEGIESTEPARMLMRMARTAGADAKLAADLQQGTPADAWTRLRAHAAFAAELDRYLDRYGDRCMGELKLETISLREDPSFLVQVLRNYLARPDLDPDRLAAEERARRDTAEQDLSRKLGWRGRRRLRKALRAARAAIKWRENMRLQRTRGFGVIRDLYRAVGRRLGEARRLDAPRDVFYLTTDEIAGYHDGTGASADLASIARARKAEYARYEKLEMPNRFETVGPVSEFTHFEVAQPNETELAQRTLRGIGCSSGVVESELRVILGPQDAASVNGKILTTLRTDPGWAPLFPTATGILVERGSTLSHSAVLARELGIPAVVGVPNLLKIVRDGERARLDGSAGTVERLDEP